MFYIYITYLDNSDEIKKFDDLASADNFFEECVNDSDVVTCLLGQVLYFYKEEE